MDDGDWGRENREQRRVKRRFFLGLKLKREEEPRKEMEGQEWEIKLEAVLSRNTILGPCSFRWAS
jgi:hypothetical protein